MPLSRTIRAWTTVVLWVPVAALMIITVSAQTPAPVERVAFPEALSRAFERNPSSAAAAAAILRAEALLTQAQSATRLQVNGTVTTTTLNRGVKFEDATVVPQNQISAGLDVRLPLYAPALWARRTQAQDSKDIAERSAENVRRQTALATADAYLTIIARRRVVDANVRARETARAHFELASELEQRGAGSRLNQLRAQQELSVDDGLVESAQLALYRAQEALGVLLVIEGPVDAGDEPLFAIPETGAAPVPDGAVAGAPTGGPGSGLLLQRTDLKLFVAEQQAAERVLQDSSKDSSPYFEAILQPQSTYPSQAFAPANSARFLLQLSIPLFDGGQRRGLRTERQAALNLSRVNLDAATTQAGSEVRAARAAVASADRGLGSARAAAEQAQQVVDIVNVSFRAGAATNIEVIDAERRGRDADTAVAVAEDTLRRARLDLLSALGLFP